MLSSTANDDAGDIDQEQLAHLEWATEVALQACAEDDPDGVAAFRALYMSPSFPGAENALPGSYTRRDMAEDLGTGKDAVTKRAARIGDRLKELMPELLRVWTGRTVGGRRQVTYDPRVRNRSNLHHSREGFGGNIP